MLGIRAQAAASLRRIRLGHIIAILLALSISGCTSEQEGTAATNGRPTTPPLATLMPSPTAVSPTPETTTALPSDSGWLSAAPGAELRRLQVSHQGQTAPVSVVRLDPALVRFEVGYQPATPLSLTNWGASFEALAVINGGFFDETGQTVALLVHDGQAVGESYAGRGGMFAVSPDGTVSLRLLADRPFDPGEPLAEALQGWPALVRPGGVAAYSYEDGERHRRSTIAIDQAGRVLLIATPGAHFTLAEWSTWLAASDLEIMTAMNLDGGSSTGLLLNGTQVREQIDPFITLPIVLLALPR